MIGLAIGAGALLGYAFIRHARWHHAHACGMHMRGWHGGNPWHGNPWGGNPWGGNPWAMRRFGRWRLYQAMAALDLSPAQEKLVRTELGALKERVRALRPELRQTRDDVARAVGGATFDRGALDGAFARHDQAFADVRGAFAGALERIHAALDDHQRERLAEMLGRAHGGAGPGGGPYRV
jgi:uncharacterized membrane protein